MSPTITALINQKGGVGKSTTCLNLGVGLAQAGKNVLLVDLDAQSSLTISMGYPYPDTLDTTIATQMTKVVMDVPLLSGEGILHHQEGVDLLPSSIELAGMEVSLVNAMARESVLKQVLQHYAQDYDHILIDCMPSLGLLTLNALAAADRVLVPVQAQYLSAKGLEQLLTTVNRIRRQINPRLEMEGILLTMVDNRTNDAKEIGRLLRNTYGSQIPVFRTEIPHSVRAAECAALGKSIYAHAPKSKVAEAYKDLTKEVLIRETERNRTVEHDVR